MSRLKRYTDVVITLLGVPLVIPAALIVAALVRYRIGSPVLFTQKRPGLHGRIFTMYKFRTMTDARGSTGELLCDAERLTPFGRFLRSTSLDELPELINVLKGEMSLVGPRPLLVEYLNRYTKEQARRHAVLPGITGWAQINGRNAISWEEKFNLDIWYVENQTFLLDLKILGLTLLKVFKRDGINQQGEATMELFKGSPDQNGDDNESQ